MADSIIFSKTFSNTSSNIVSGLQGTLPLVMGVPSSTLNGVNDKYIVSIKVTAPGSPLVIINAFLQEKINMSASSNWNNIGQMFGSDDIDTMGQGVSALLGNRISLNSTIGTRRKWTGSEPISMKLVLKFEAYTDVYKEVVSPCFGLQSLTLPSGGFADTLFLRPPGPDPFSWNPKSSTDQGELISIDVGGFLQFNSVIVKSVDVEYENRMNIRGPIGAKATVTFQTYQMLTKKDLEGVYNSVGATFQGTLGVNSSKSGTIGPASGGK